MIKKNQNINALTYHKILDHINFERQLIYLKKKYHIIGYQNVINYFQNNQLPKNPLILTFDDGDISNYTVAFPLLKKHDIPAFLFVITDLINTDKPFWWDEVQYYLGMDIANKKLREIKKWTNYERQQYLKKLRKDSEKPLLKYLQLKTEQLKEMQDNRILIGNHSHTHPMFDRCTSEELNSELLNSFYILNDLGFNPEVFAYPNGNFSSMAEKMLKEHGVKYSFLFDHKINRGEINSLKISRLIVNDTTPLWKFKLILSGWHSRILPFSRFVGKLKSKIIK